MKTLQEAEEAAREDLGLPYREGTLTYREIAVSLLNEDLIDAPARGEKMKELLADKYSVLEEAEPSDIAKEEAADERRIQTRYRVADEYKNELDEIRWEEIHGALNRA